nr:hypothetical protein Iba_chr06aCG12640 [Ipomoea batatas]GMD43491.1 hypothetical protein Iba_chr10cCG5830 [Ipomoea batatas]GMD46886.1 hypothetical protein Iba_scaffold1340144CG0010 [Ipomoea batatas]
MAEKGKLTANEILTGNAHPNSSEFFSTKEKEKRNLAHILDRDRDEGNLKVNNADPQRQGGVGRLWGSKITRNSEGKMKEENGPEHESKSTSGQRTT